jgi:hypothetical protein
MNANQEKAEADRIADREYRKQILAEMKADREKLQAETEAIREKTKAMRDKRIEADREIYQEELKGMMNATEEIIDTNTKEMNAKMDANQTEMRFIICTFQSEFKKTIQRAMRAAIQFVWSELDETTACREATETEPDPGVMQYIEEHQEIPKGEAAVMPVGEPRKRRRVCNLAAERRQK